jgi:hypothetical protein
MEKVTFKVMLACAAALPVFLSSAAFAQGGGNGQGGTGGGNAHGAATAGMTYHGDPISSPWTAMPGKFTDSAWNTETSAKLMSPDENVEKAKTGQ